MEKSEEEVEAKKDELEEGLRAKCRELRAEMRAARDKD